MPKIVINISDDIYRKIHMGKSIDPYYLGNAIKNGVILLDEKKKYLPIIEDIKADIRTLYPQYGDGSGWCETRSITLNEVMKMIDNHIFT